MPAKENTHLLSGTGVSETTLGLTLGRGGVHPDPEAGGAGTIVGIGLGGTTEYKSLPPPSPLRRSDGAGHGIFGGIVDDLRNRAPHYASDWTDGFGVGLLGPATYIFFASVIPALTFGEQISDGTEGKFGASQVLLATALCGVLQSVFGGQPLLIVGVAEPIILIYAFMHTFATEYDIPYRAWCSVTLFWAGGMIVTLAASNACGYIHRFTRFSGELFGLLIAVLFLQQGIKGLTLEFGVGPDVAWRVFSGVWALLLGFGLVITSFVLRGAQSWRFFNPTVRGLISDYATVAMVLVWSIISYAPQFTPEGVPQRLSILDATSAESKATWSTIDKLGELELWHVFAALVPAFIITVLFYFDHNVSAQLAQVTEFGLKKPDAYHWDFFLLGIMTIVCGVCGIPPVNGVLPQAPLHTRACAIADSRDILQAGGTFKVNEQRWTNLIQSLLCTACLFLAPMLQKIPRSVLWGFFIYMGLDSLEGSQFWDRLLLFFTDSKLLPKLIADQHAAYLETVPKTTVNNFTLLQLAAFLACYGITWGGAVGIGFPLLIMLLVPVRLYVLPDLFNPADLAALDPLDGDDAVCIPETPALGTIANIALNVKESTPSGKDAIRGMLKGGGMYNQGRGSAPARSLDTIKIATLLSQSLTAGKLSQEEYELILRTTSRAALAGAL